MLSTVKRRDAVMLLCFLAALALAAEVSCQPQLACGEWVEARELEGREVRALVAVREGVFAATD